MKVHPIASLMPRMPAADFEALLQSLRVHGYDPAHPIILFEGDILDGRHRKEACDQLGIKPFFKTWAGGDPWDFVWRENAVRRHLEAGQKAAIHLEFVKGSDAWQAEQRSMRRDAKIARSESTKQQPRLGRRVSGPVSRDTRPESAPKPLTASMRERLAASAGVSPATMQRAIDLRAKDPDTFERVKRGEVTLNKALNETKLHAKRALAEEIRANPVVTPDGAYQVIVIDPPWKYDNRAEDTTHRGKNLYPEMTVPEICALPVSRLAQNDCVLWLWTTNAFMRDAYACLDAWGFKDKTILTWDKVNLGLGDWLRNVTEHCILATRGRPVVSLTNQTTLISEKRREHSRKPDAFYALVEALCPGSKLEMFSRTEREGWAAWGAETGKFDAAE